ncbi:prion-inhibition and propagation-domain-containing protein [Fusarium flagelliforme]|uniref:prion-inhibition and propagation-domain-containing protein n=1 Tax=Fusarium flagelliforme TaxID=2675880 RepID=UPI001E8E7EEA|nr:prion-inhibition and propagation-domain-containing protein [Fusarium flagelliforme]KAH7174130.1 prion-inhibition and propagation-domain-containing protein [Fusarium flagelliforme]
MAEVFGAVAGAISIAALFNNCIDCFDYIQLAKSFGEDFSRYQLRLDVAKCRLSRWGAAIDINNDSRFLGEMSSDPTVELAKNVLREIVESFGTAHRTSLRYKAASKEQSTATCGEADLEIVSQRLHNRFRTLTIKRQSRVSLIKKAYWAIYDKDHMGRVIDGIFHLLNELEKVFPTIPQATRELAEMEIKEVSDQQELKMIQDVAKGLDPVLEDTTKSKIRGITGMNTVGRIDTRGRANVGYTFATESLIHSEGFRDNTTNRVNEIIGGENSRVNVGNTYGGTGFWD